MTMPEKLALLHTRKVEMNETSPAETHNHSMMPNRFDVYYDVADSRIGVARLDLPQRLPGGALADRPALEGSVK